MGKIRIVNPATGKTVIEEYDDGTTVYFNVEMKEAVQNNAKEGYTPSTEELKELIEKAEEEEVEADPLWASEGKVVPYESGPVIQSGSWNASGARQRLAKWASSDGSGKKDKVNYSKYKKGFLIIDGDPENFGSYKYPHHDVKSGSLHVHRQGVISAMAFLLRVRPAEISAGYNHLSKHYRNDLKMDPPPLKKEAYTNDEMAQYFGEDWRDFVTQALELE